MSSLFNWSQKRSVVFIIGAMAFAFITYYLLLCKYVLYNGDDVWTLTRVFHFSRTGENVDTIFRAVETTDRVQLFGLSYNYIYGWFLDLFGWTRTNAHILCSTFILISGVVWFFILRTLKFSSNLAWVFMLSLPLFPAYFGAGHLTRTDPLAFFCASLAFLLFIKRRYFFAGLVLVLGVETHIMGSIGGFYILAFVLYEWKYFFSDIKKLLLNVLRFFVGVAIGVCYYLYLHQDVFSVERFFDLLASHKNAKELPSYLITYFIQTEWYLHVWEFVLIVSTIVLYLKNKIFKENEFVWIFLLVLLASTFILSRPNRVYMLFIFPSIHLLILYTAEKMNAIKQVTLLLFAIFFVHYGVIYSMHRTYDFENIITEIENTIKDDKIPVVGIADVWFAAKDRKFHLIFNNIKDIPERDIQEAYVVETDFIFPISYTMEIESMAMEKGITKDPLLAKRRKHYLGVVNYFKDNYDCELVNTSKGFKEDSLKIWLCKKGDIENR